MRTADSVEPTTPDPEIETLTVTSTQAIVHSSMSSNPAYVSLPNLCCGTAKGKRNTTHTL